MTWVYGVTWVRVIELAFEAETKRQATNNRKLIGPKMSFSWVLNEVMFPSVLSAINAVMIQETTLSTAGIKTFPTRPARYRMTKMNPTNRTAEKMLAMLNEAVNWGCRPPQAIEIGKIPSASNI
jgi:hypothetical protein